MIRVIGLDLSLTATGIAAADGETLLTVGGDAKEGDHRLVKIRDMVVREASDEVDVAAVEDLPRTVHGSSSTGMVQGVIRVALRDLGVPYVLVPPATLKMYATGKGSADKADMRMALFQRAGLDVKDNNQVDAWWLRALVLDLYGEPIVQLPQTHRRALAKVKAVRLG